MDLEKDNEKLNYYKNFHTKRIEYLDTLLTYVRNPIGIEKYGMYVEPLYYSVNPTNYLTLSNRLSQWGRLMILKKKKLKDLSQYYADFVFIENTINSITRIFENQFKPLMYKLPEGYMKENTGNLVINEENVQEFYNKVASIKDNLNINYDYERILRTSIMEKYLNGDMGRTNNAIGKINSRQEMLTRLKINLKKYD